jgi:Protein of unknown function (DUF4058)
MPIHDWTRVNAGIFHHFHHRWIAAISDALNEGVLPPDYYALAEQIAGGLGPDVLTLENVPPQAARSGGNGPGVAGAGNRVAILLATAPPRVRFTARAEPEEYARKGKAVAIRHASDDRVVAIVEIVSPGNKASRHGLRSFVDKAVEILEAGVHLLVLDLFPPGPRDPQGIHAAVWSEICDDDFRLPPDKPLTLVAYSAGAPKTAFIEPVAFGDALPEMPLFLEPDLYVPVPLEPTYRIAWEKVPKRWRDVLEPPGTA